MNIPHLVNCFQQHLRIDTVTNGQSTLHALGKVEGEF